MDRATMEVSIAIRAMKALREREGLAAEFAGGAVIEGVSLKNVYRFAYHGNSNFQHKIISNEWGFVQNKQQNTYIPD